VNQKNSKKIRVNYLLSLISTYYVPYQSDGTIGLSAA